MESVFLAEEGSVKRLKDHQICLNLIPQFLDEEKKVRVETWEDKWENFAKRKRIYQRNFVAENAAGLEGIGVVAGLEGIGVGFSNASFQHLFDKKNC